MKAMLISFAVGLVVGVAYGLLHVKSPAPPLVALAGLLGMVWGEQAAVRFLIKTPPSPAVKSAPAGDSDPTLYRGDGRGLSKDPSGRPLSR